ncbi:MAG: hypothetical protein RJQ00_00870 [Vicingaceae bacterium]
MNKSILSLIVLIGLAISTNAQICYKAMDVKNDVTVKYKWKENKEGKRELRIKFKNQTGSAVNVDTEFGFYLNGVMEEKVVINDCLKKSFFDNWFRPVHIIMSETLTNEQLTSKELEVQVSEMNTTKVEECRETDS